MIEYKIVRKQVKNARIKIDLGFNVTVVIPMNYPSGRLEKLMLEKSIWINKTIERLKNNIKSIPLSENDILLFGEIYSFQHDNLVNNRILTYKESKIIKSDRLLTKDPELLRNWYRHHANKFIPQRIRELAALHGYEFNRIFIRDQKTKWGTCSSNRNISLNWRIVLCPQHAADYLILHELAHLKEMNHSARFWNEVARTCPGFKKSKKWLREYEAFIFKY